MSGLFCEHGASFTKGEGVEGPAVLSLHQARFGGDNEYDAAAEPRARLDLTAKPPSIFATG